MMSVWGIAEANSQIKMRKLNFLWMLGLLMFAAVNFSACSSDDDEPGSSSELIGLWESVSQKGWEKENGKIEYEWDEKDNDYRVQFNSDGTWEGFEYYEGEWDLCDTGTWEYKGGKLYMTYDDEDEDEATDILNVKELTSSRLAVEVSWREEYEGVIYETYTYSVLRKIN